MPFVLACGHAVLSVFQHERVPVVLRLKNTVDASVLHSLEVAVYGANGLELGVLVVDLAFHTRLNLTSIAAARCMLLVELVLILSLCSAATSVDDKTLPELQLHCNDLEVGSQSHREHCLVLFYG
jgi:hypothetical protein